MKNILMTFSFIFFVNSIIWPQNPCVTEIEIKEGIVFKKGVEYPFTGEYKEYYPGVLKVSGQYLDGLKHGLFTYLNHNRSYYKTVNYSYGLKHGREKYYEDNNYLISSENYQNDTLHGECYYWYSGGQLEKVITYKNGVVVKEEECEYDTTIFKIWFKIEGSTSDLINRFFFSTKDTIDALLINVDEDGNETEIMNENYEIISFTYGIIGDNSRYEYTSPIIVNEHRYLVTNRFWRFIEITDLLIKNPCGQKYYLPGRIFKVVD